MEAAKIVAGAWDGSGLPITAAFRRYAPRASGKGVSWKGAEAWKAGLSPLAGHWPVEKIGADYGTGKGGLQSAVAVPGSHRDGRSRIKCQQPLRQHPVVRGSLQNP